MNRARSNAAPDPRDRLEVYAAKSVGERMDRLVCDLERVDDSAGEDPVHDLRVAVRRLNSALVLFQAMFPKKASAAIRKKLSRLRRLAGEVRDRDICLKLAEKDLDAKSPNLEALGEQRAVAAEKLRKRVRKVLRNSSVAVWREELGLPPEGRGKRPAGPRAASFAAAMLPEMAQRFFLAGRAALEGTAPIHPLRIRGKKLRYSLEIFAPCYGAEIEGLIERLKAVQDFLGDINDCKAADDLLTSGASPDESSRIRKALKARDRELLDRFRRYWTDSFDAPGELETWLLTLRRGG